MPSPSTNARAAVLLAICAAAISLGGCEDKKVHAAAPVAAAPAPAAMERPMSVAPDTDATPPSEAVATPPAVPTTEAAPPQAVAIPQPKPVVPRKPAEASTESIAEQPTHPVAPQIAPQLSDTDQAAYFRKTEEDTKVAEQNLQQTSGKQLNAAQQDLVGKIRSFLSQSKDASKDGDWARAQNLAQKARLLSGELIGSF